MSGANTVPGLARPRGWAGLRPTVAFRQRPLRLCADAHAPQVVALFRLLTILRLVCAVRLN